MKNIMKQTKNEQDDNTESQCVQSFQEMQIDLRAHPKIIQSNQNKQSAQLFNKNPSSDQGFLGVNDQLLTDHVFQNGQEDQEGDYYYQNMLNTQLSDYMRLTETDKPINECLEETPIKINDRESKVEVLNTNSKDYQIGVNSHPTSIELQQKQYDKFQVKKNINKQYSREIRQKMSLNEHELSSKRFKRRLSEADLDIDLSKLITPLNLQYFTKEQKHKNGSQDTVEQTRKKELSKKRSFNNIFSSTFQKMSTIYPTTNITHNHETEAVVEQPSSIKDKMMNQVQRLLMIKNKFLGLISNKLTPPNQYERQLINDSSDSHNSFQTEKTQSMLTKILSYTFHPASLPIMFFKSCMLIITLYNIFIVPLIIGFYLDMDSKLGTLQSLSGIFFLIEIFINFRISLYVKGQIITDQKLIALKYINSELLFDAISVLGCALGTQGTINNLCLLLVMVRINNILTYLNDMNNHFYLSEKYNKTWTLTRLIIFIMYMAHVFACIFHYIGVSHDGDPNYKTWIEAQQLQNQHPDVRYNYALYYAFITMITIGYGDITPQNSHERIACMAFALFSSFIFSFSINTIGNIFQDYFYKYQKLIVTRYNAIQFLNNRKIEKDLQLRVLQYIDYIYEIENESPDQGITIINKLSNDLKEEVFKNYYGEIIKKNKHFQLNYSPSSIDKLVLKIQEKIFAPGEIIFEQGDQDDRLYYIIKGECEFYLKNQGGNKLSQYQTIFQQNETEFFGYKGFISGMQREMSCKSKNISHVFFIDRKDLIKVLQEDPQDYEQFCRVRDKFLLYTNSLGEVCYGCKTFGHTLIYCPRLHLVNKRDIIALRYNYSRDQVRQEKQRKNNQKEATFKNHSLVYESVLSFKKKLIIELYKKNFAQTITNEQLEQIQQIPLEEIQESFPFICFQEDGMVIYQDKGDEKETEEENNEWEGEEQNTDSEEGSQISIEQIDEQDESFYSNDSNQTKNLRVVQESAFETNSNNIQELQKNQFKKTRSSIMEDETFEERNLKEDKGSSPSSSQSTPKRKINKNRMTNLNKKDDTNQNSQQQKKRHDFYDIQEQIDQSSNFDSQFIFADTVEDSHPKVIDQFEDKNEKSALPKFQSNQLMSPSSHTNNMSEREITHNRSPEMNNYMSDLQPPLLYNNKHKQQKQLRPSQHLIEESLTSYKKNSSNQLYQDLGLTNRGSQVINLKPNSQSGLSNNPNKSQTVILNSLNPLQNKQHSKQNSKSSFSHPRKVSLLVQKHEQRFSLLPITKSLTQRKESKQEKKSSLNTPLLFKDNQNLVLQQILDSLSQIKNKLALSNSKFISKREIEEINAEHINKSIPLFTRISQNNSQTVNQNSNQSTQKSLSVTQQVVLNKVQPYLSQRHPQQIPVDLFIYEFDSLKEYKNYFPYNNSSIVCKKFNRIIEKSPALKKMKLTKEFSKTKSKFVLQS